MIKDSKAVKKAIATAIILASATVVALVFTPSQGGVDWQYHLKPATLALLDGRSPYSAATVFNPPWTFLLLAPFAFLPYQVMTITGLCAYAIVAVKLGIQQKWTNLLIMSPPVMVCLAMGNIDWLAMLGLWIRPLWLALFFLSIKPQIGLPFALYRIIDERKPSHAIPVTAAFLLSIVLYGPWFQAPDGNGWNASLWPLSLVAAVPLYILSLKHSNKWIALLLTPFLVPYITPQGYATTLYGIAGLHKRPVFYIAFVAGWALLLWPLMVYGSG